MSSSEPSGLPRPKSFQDHIPTSSSTDGVSNCDQDEAGGSAAATLTTTQMNTGPGSIPAPFRSIPQYRQYPTPNSLPPNMTTSGYFL